MKADKIIKNAKIFTANKDNPLASALVVKDGKFVYVGDETGLAGYEGEVADLGGKFIMPGIIDSHVHVTMGTGFEYTDMGPYVACDSKKGALDFMADYIASNPGRNRYRFLLERVFLHGDDITKEDLDAICPDAEIVILEGEAHSVWVNSRTLARHGVTDDVVDPVPGLSYYVRKDGHVTGNVFEAAAEIPFLLDEALELTDEQIDAALLRWIDYSVKVGVVGVFDAGIPECNELHERIYTRLRELDRQGKLPVYIDGCYVITQPRQVPEALEELKRFERKFDTDHLKVHTLKIFNDGTLKIHTAAMVTPYEDTHEKGTAAFNKEQIADLLLRLNEAGLDLHLHTVGEGASRNVLDGVEMARKTLGDKYRVKVTCAHLEVQDDADLDRFAKLGVNANYTPWWHAGNMGGNPYETWCVLLGEKRALSMYRCKSVWNSGANVTWSCDDIHYGDFTNWSPYLGMEVGMTRWINESTRTSEISRTVAAYPPVSEQMSIEEMITGYTINGARQLGIEAAKGSIEVGKDADFLVFDNDLLTAEHEGFSQNKPSEVYFSGRKVN
ncbi:MAG: amidohydrolase family protein [Lachnospiraceae bacterium]|nr:amidohydrolase family protein [Lachnospiraceae bacterium]